MRFINRDWNLTVQDDWNLNVRPRLSKGIESVEQYAVDGTMVGWKIQGQYQ